MQIVKGVFIATLLAANCALACINGYENDVNDLIQRVDPKKVALTVDRLEEQYKRDPSAEVANDLAVVLILAAKTSRAIEILTRLEQEKPGLSKTASNLGTALELDGRTKDAMLWIQEGMKRNPDDHEGTEWLHVKILEAKLALLADPSWLKTHTVLGVHFGTEDFPQRPSQNPVDHLGRSYSLLDAKKAITYQLHERTKFVFPPDAVVADLYGALGDILYVTEHASATSDYERAIAFGAADVPAIKKRILYIKTHWWGVSFAVWALLAGTTLCGLVYYLWTRKQGRKRKVPTDLAPS